MNTIQKSIDYNRKLLKEARFTLGILETFPKEMMEVTMVTHKIKDHIPDSKVSLIFRETLTAENSSEFFSTIDSLSSGVVDMEVIKPKLWRRQLKPKDSTEYKDEHEWTLNMCPFFINVSMHTGASLHWCAKHLKTGITMDMQIGIPDSVLRMNYQMRTEKRTGDKYIVYNDMSGSAMEAKTVQYLGEDIAVRNSTHWLDNSIVSLEAQLFWEQLMTDTQPKTYTEWYKLLLG